MPTTTCLHRLRSLLPSSTDQNLQQLPKERSCVSHCDLLVHGMKNVDDNGNSAPILSKKAKKHLDDYKDGAKPDESSQELDGNVLYSIGGGMPHGRVPIANGAVDKAEVLAAAKSNNVQPTNSAAYRSVVEENEQLKETNEQLQESNEKLKETNEILVEENNVNRELIMRFHADFSKEPPADLLNRLANIDTRRHQRIGSSHACSHPDDMRNNVNDVDCDDGDNGCDDMYGDEGCNDMYGDEGCDDMDDEENGGSEEVNMPEDEYGKGGDDHVDTN